MRVALSIAGHHDGGDVDHAASSPGLVRSRCIRSSGCGSSDIHRLPRLTAPTPPTEAKPLPTRRKKGGKAAASAALDAALYVSRFPEDEVYDDYESGEMGSWKVLGLSVPLTTIQINEANEESELAADEIDLKKVRRTAPHALLLVNLTPPF